jgi:hypothetical protein
VETNTREEQVTIDLWREEISSYVQPKEENPQAQDMAYLIQTIEVDAIAFSYVHMERFFGVQIRIPEAIHDQVQTLVNRRFGSDSSSH